MQVFITGVVKHFLLNAMESRWSSWQFSTWAELARPVTVYSPSCISWPGGHRHHRVSWNRKNHPLALRKGAEPCFVLTHHFGVSLLCGGSGIPAMLSRISSIPSADGELLPWCSSASYSGCINTALATATKPERTIKEQGQEGEKTDKIREIEQREGEDKHTYNRKFHVSSKGESHEQWGSLHKRGKKTQQNPNKHQRNVSIEKAKGKDVKIKLFTF